MSSEDDKIVHSVEAVIASIGELVHDIGQSSRLDVTQKETALTQIGVFADQLKQIHGELFAFDDDALSQDGALSQDDDDGEAPLTEEVDELGRDVPVDQSAVENPVEGDALAPAPVAVSSMKLVVKPAEKRSLKDSVEQDSVEQDSLEQASATNVSSEEEFSERVQSVDPTVEAPEGSDGEALEAAAEFVSSQARAEDSQGAEAEPPVGNNLQLIDGVDESVEELLHAHGIYYFSDIAAFHGTDVKKISDALDDPFRVARENWIEQATLLAQDVSTRYANHQVGATVFERLSLIGACETEGEVSPVVDARDEIGDAELIQEEREGALLDEAVSDHVSLDHDTYDDDTYDHDLSEASVEDEPALQEVAALGETLLREKQVLEAELAALREELAATSQISEPDMTGEDGESVSPSFVQMEAEQETLVDDEVGASYYANDVERDLSDDERDLISDPSHLSPRLQEKLRGDYDAPLPQGDGAIWHEEVSVGPDYQPPIVDDEDSFSQSDEGPGHGQQTVGDDLVDPLAFVDGADISMPMARVGQDDYVNRVYGERDDAGVKDEGSDRRSPEELPHFSEAALGAVAVPPPLPDREESGVPADQDMPPGAGLQSEPPLPPDLSFQGDISQAGPPPLPPVGADAPLPPGQQRPPAPPPFVPQGAGHPPGGQGLPPMNEARLSDPQRPDAQRRDAQRPDVQRQDAQGPETHGMHSRGQVAAPNGVYPQADARQPLKPPPAPAGMPPMPPAQQRSSLPPKLPPVVPGSPRLPLPTSKPLPGQQEQAGFKPPPEVFQEPLKREKQVSDDFKLKARKFAESLQKSFTNGDD